MTTTTTLTITITLTGPSPRLAAGARRQLAKALDDLAAAAARLSYEATAEGDRGIPPIGARAPMEITSSSAAVAAALTL